MDGDSTAIGLGRSAKTRASTEADRKARTMTELRSVKAGIEIGTVYCCRPNMSGSADVSTPLFCVREQNRRASLDFHLHLPIGGDDDLGLRIRSKGEIPIWDWREIEGFSRGFLSICRVSLEDFS